jgi:solute carrier family 25 carnitine/acylcarnitine transporter 20/29
MTTNAKPIENNSQWNWDKYFEASWQGAARGLAGLPVEHPFDTVKTKCQAEGGTKSAMEITKELWKKGVPSFYSGAVPNGLRVAGKQIYRYPMMLDLPPRFKRTFPDSVMTQYPTLPKAATGLTIAAFEVGLLTPLERMKVHLMTSLRKGHTIRKFFADNRGHLGKEMTRGLNAMFVRQMATWVSFLVADEKFKTWEKRRTKTEKLSFASLMGVSFMVGAVNTAANMPFDSLKTQLTKEHPVDNEGVYRTISKVYRTYGVRGLYAGWQVRMMQYMLQSSITVPLLERLEQSWKAK